MKNIKLLFLACLLLVMGVVTVKAQITTGEIPDQPTQVRLVDNKGTIKYLQVRNGITMLTNTSGNINTTTWQLGGTLENNTTISLNGKFFQIGDMLMRTNANATANGPVNTLTNSSDVTTGLTFVMRDQVTGALVTMMASDPMFGGGFIQAGQAEFEVGTAANITVGTPAAVVGMPAEYSKVSIYRNGTKLRANVDYTIAAGLVTLVNRSTIPTPVNQRWSLFAGDILEVHWVK